MNIFNNIYLEINKIISNNNNKFICDTINKYLSYDSIILNKNKKIINIYGKLLSGKTTLKSLLINKICSDYNGVNIHIKNISILDKYNESETFDNILLFIKGYVNKNDIKILIIDDFDSFTKLFQSKIECLLSYVQISFLITSKCYDFNIVDSGTDVLSLNTYNFNNIREICDCVKERIHKGNINDYLNIHMRSNNMLQLSYLQEKLEETNNIYSFLSNLEILQYIGADINGYNYLNLVENSCIYNILLNSETKKEIINYLYEKNKNNENIKDCILLLENNVYDIFYKMNLGTCQVSDIKLNILEKILHLCNDFKTKIISIINKKREVNYKLLFNYFILKISLI